MKLDKSKLIAILMDEVKNDPQLLMKVVELLPTLLRVWERVQKEAKEEDPKAPSAPEPTAPKPQLLSPQAWLENAFHSWYQKPGVDGDMTSTSEADAIRRGEAGLPPAAVAWLMSNRPAAFWCFSLDGGDVVTYKDEVWTGPKEAFIQRAWYKEQPGTGDKDARHILVRFKALEGLHTVEAWIHEDMEVSPTFKFTLGGKR